MIRAVVISLALAGPVMAQEAEPELRPAPAYYTEAIFAVAIAEALASGCSSLGMDFLAVQSNTSEVQERLVADGFDASAPYEQMTDQTDALRALQDDFLAKYPLNSGSATPDEVCAAGRAEIEMETLIGAMLVDPGALE